jgi:hypothetical protein
MPSMAKRDRNFPSLWTSSRCFQVLCHHLPVQPITINRRVALSVEACLGSSEEFSCCFFAPFWKAKSGLQWRPLTFLTPRFDTTNPSFSTELPLSRYRAMCIAETAEAPTAPKLMSSVASGAAGCQSVRQSLRAGQQPRARSRCISRHGGVLLSSMKEQFACHSKRSFRFGF